MSSNVTIVITTPSTSGDEDSYLPGFFILDDDEAVGLHSSMKSEEQAEKRLSSLMQADLSAFIDSCGDQLLKPTPDVAVFLRVLAFLPLDDKVEKLRSLQYRSRPFLASLHVCRAWRFIVARAYKNSFAELTSVSKALRRQVCTQHMFFDLPKLSTDDDIVEFEIWRLNLEHQYYSARPDMVASRSEVERRVDLFVSGGPLPLAALVGFVLTGICVPVVGAVTSFLFVARLCLAASLLLVGTTSMITMCCLRSQERLLSMQILLEFFTVMSLVIFAPLYAVFVSSMGVIAGLVMALTSAFIGASIIGAFLLAVINPCCGACTRQTQGFGDYYAPRYCNLVEVLFLLTFEWNLPLLILLCLPEPFLVGPPGVVCIVFGVAWLLALAVGSIKLMQVDKKGYLLQSLATHEILGVSQTALAKPQQLKRLFDSDLSK